MFKAALFIAAVLSILACVAYDVAMRVKLAETELQIADRQTEIIQTSRMRRADLIHQAKAVEDTTDDAVAMLHALNTQANDIETVSITGAKKVVVRGRAQAQKVIDDLAAKLGMSVTYEVKR